MELLLCSCSSADGELQQLALNPRPPLLGLLVECRQCSACCVGLGRVSAPGLSCASVACSSHGCSVGCECMTGHAGGVHTPAVDAPGDQMGLTDEEVLL